MPYCITSTRATVPKAGALFSLGALCFGYGLHLSYVNIAPQRAKVDAKREFLRAHIKRTKGIDVYSG